MTISTVLDVAIGIVFVFFLFSIVASGIHELVARVLATRSKQLWRALGNLLDDDHETQAGLQRASTLVLGLTRSRDPRPTLAQALNPAPDSVTQKLWAHSMVRGLDDTDRWQKWTRTRLSHIEPDLFSRALLDVLSGDTLIADTATFQDFVSELPNCELRRELSAIARHAGEYIEDVREDVGHWFDTRMEALSKAYRRRTRWWLFVVGVIVAVGFNVDAIHVTDTFYEQDALRALVAAEAESLVGTCTFTEGVPDDTCKEQLTDASDALRLPVWWGESEINRWSVPGWLIAGAAIAQGGPFWFDLLRRLAGFKKAAMST